MERVFVTEAQRVIERYEKLREYIGNRVEGNMRLNRLKIMETARGLGIGHETLTKIMGGEDVKLSTTTWLKILDLAGLKLDERRSGEK